MKAGATFRELHACFTRMGLAGLCTFVLGSGYKRRWTLPELGVARTAQLLQMAIARI
jgi:hypothetical protein